MSKIEWKFVVCVVFVLLAGTAIGQNSPKDRQETPRRPWIVRNR